MNSRKHIAAALKSKMHYRQIQTKFTLVRYYAMQTVKTLPLPEQDKKLLEQQISELIHNACIHGNQNKEELAVHVWHSFKDNVFTIIIQDEGSGFSNDNNREEFSLFAAYQKRGSFTPEYCGGTGLFAAASYWDRGFSFSKEGNTVSASKIFYPSFIEEEYDLN